MVSSSECAHQQSVIIIFTWLFSCIVLDCELNSRIIAFQPLAYYVPPPATPPAARRPAAKTPPSSCRARSSVHPTCLSIVFCWVTAVVLPCVSLISSACRVARPALEIVEEDDMGQCCGAVQVIHIGQMVIIIIILSQATGNAYNGKSKHKKQKFTSQPAKWWSSPLVDHFQDRPGVLSLLIPFPSSGMPKST